MIQLEVSSKNSKYDERHDVLHVFLGNSSNGFMDEEYPGVYVNRDDSTDDVVGLTLMDFKKRRTSIVNWLPQYKFSL